MGLVVLAGLAFSATGAGAQTPPPISDVKMEIGQGKASFHGRLKYRARGTLSFLANSDGVRCTDKVVLERRVREIVNRRLRYRWIEIARGDQRERTCADRPAAPKPLAQHSAVSLYHDDAAYRRILRTSALRVRYEVVIAVGGRTAFRRSASRPVTLATMAQPYRSAPV
jgi:hypothetical protein